MSLVQCISLTRDAAVVNGPDPSLLAGIVSIAYIQINKRDFNKKSHNAARRGKGILRRSERETRSSNRFPESAIINTVCALIQQIINFRK